MLSPSVSALLLLLVTAASGSTSCRCLSTNATCWPSSSTFGALNRTVSGNLIPITPPGAVCYPGSSTYNAVSCTALQAGTTNPFLRGDIPGAAMYPKSEGDENGVVVCPLTPGKTSCAQGRVPVIGVQVSSVADVQAAVKFAVAHNLRLTVKNTGHDQSSRSFAAGSFQIWTHKMRGIQFSSAFTPQNCASAGTFSAVTVQAGEQWGNVYQAADAKGQVVVGGAAMTVGAAGGFVAGGGHGPLSRSYGLAADNVLEINVVTADGTAQTVNACNNPDLFWAMRGGGSGFGVVTSITYKTYRSPSTAMAFYTVSSSSSANMLAFMKNFVNVQPQFAAAGISGYIGFSLTSSYLELFQPNGTAATMAAAVKIALAFATSPKYVVSGGVSTNTSFYKEYSTVNCLISPGGLCTEAVGASSALGSRLIPTAQFATQASKDKLSTVMTNILNDGAKFFLVHLVSGGAVANFAPDSNAASPAWRNSLWHLLVANGWTSDATAATIATNRAASTRQTKMMIDLAPGSGAYVNEADLAEPNWQTSFWGTNYPRLLQIKKTVDPNGLFYCAKCVGSELWSADGNCKL